MTRGWQVLGTPERSLSAVEACTWALGLTMYVVGDVVTTALGVLATPGVVEQNAVAAGAIAQLGLWPALIGLKALALAWVLGCWRVSPDRYRVMFPSLLAAIGTVIVAQNTRVLLIAAGFL